MTETVLLEAREIVRRGRDGVVLLDRVSFRIAAGERWAVTGPTGSGKTVLLRSLALLDPIESGEILWRGNPVRDDDVPAFRRRVITLQQRPALIEGTVETNLQLPYQFKANRDRPFDREHCLSLLSELQLEESFLQKSTADLSGGEAQITAILRALQLEPSILLLDEPTAALDAKSTERVERLAVNWFSANAEERAIVWVTHAAAQSERVADKRLALKRGMVDDTPDATIASLPADSLLDRR